jgi:hypothetical protein
VGSGNTYMSVSPWEGRSKIHIRHYESKGEGEKLFPTKKGIALTESEFEDDIKGEVFESSVFRTFNSTDEEVAAAVRPSSSNTMNKQPKKRKIESSSEKDDVVFID